MPSFFKCCSLDACLLHDGLRFSHTLQQQCSVVARRRLPCEGQSPQAIRCGTAKNGCLRFPAQLLNPPLSSLQRRHAGLKGLHGQYAWTWRKHFHRTAFVKQLNQTPTEETDNAQFDGTFSREGFSSEFGNVVIVNDSELADAKTEQFMVVNFYHIVDIKDPYEEVSRHQSYIQGRDICGRIYISHQGINAQYSGPLKDVFAYAEWVKEDPRFTDMFVQVSPAPDGHAFPRLKLRYKPSLVQIEGGTSDIPLTDPSLRAIPLTPRDWKKKLDTVARSEHDDTPDREGTTQSDKCSKPRDIFLLDVRNGYEWDVGHFKGTQRPEVDCFKNTDFGLSDREGFGSDSLAGLDKESTDILMYCTGGIRCDVYSIILRQKGFKNLYSLKGGVARYLIEEGPENWLGNLFVFDSRLAVPPGYYKSADDGCSKNQEGMQINQRKRNGTPSSFGSCQLCHEPLLLIRHRNCANLDCNQLHLVCDFCSEPLNGCCSVQCMSAPRLRPFFSVPQQYKRWHNYRPTEQSS